MYEVGVLGALLPSCLKSRPAGTIKQELRAGNLKIFLARYEVHARGQDERDSN